MIQHRPFEKLFHENHGWLDTRHHFSFASYHDPNNMGWGSIRVWNDDVIDSKSGFPPHPHSDMEIITYVRKGAITHQDNLGNTGRTEAGDVQVMSAGTGIRHAEYNLEPETTEIFQIWVMPDKRGIAPRWGAKPFPKGDRSGKFVTLASGFETDTDTLKIQTPARLLGATLLKGQTETYATEAGRHIYLVLAQGRVKLNGLELGPRDGAAIKDEAVLTIEALEDAEILLMDAQ
ncbi:pirin family protein [Asticcacaulis sp. SL142]|uniref:pirin family protein n=1 Tax=Asticcacaulis sp. SL142 TaxID=2995155 RepID=UPI00226CF439|nr:pirin family protein [Asticcacaulis sp. SL142]WAC48824.1 pirin family protein [Asticcacaulis sp. SL142]